MGLKFIKICVCLLLVINTFQITALAAENTPENIYYGDMEAKVILENTNFKDVSNAGENYWAKDAINEMAALSVIKGFGDKTFGIGASLTKVQTLALIYRAAGKEEEAQKQAEIIENQGIQGLQSTNAIESWANGYLQLAAQDGLITYNQLQDAFVSDQSMLDPETNFIKTDTAERQEVGVWLAKLFNLEPDYNQQILFNSFKDWQEADTANIPYLEAVLKEKIMNGAAEGYFYPGKGIKREEMAQVLKNASEYIYKEQGLFDKYGFIENITNETTQKLDETIETTNIDIRNNEGALDRIVVQTIYDINGNRIESDTRILEPFEKELLVQGFTKLGDSSLLKKGDKIKYVIDSDNIVRYVKQISSEEGVIFIRGEIDAIDYEEGKIEFIDEEKNKNIYVVSNNVEVNINGNTKTFNDVFPKTPTVIALKNNIVVSIEIKEFDTMYDETEITGIVEDINPGLGYISLYEESGKSSFNLLRIYNFDNPSLVEVLKDNKISTIYDIEQGDSAFIKLNEEGKVNEIAASTNYTVEYGTIITKNPSSIIVRFEDNSQKQLNISDNTIISKNGKIASYSSVSIGQKAKVTILETEDFTELKEIVIETERYNIEDIYKGYIYLYDKYNSTLIFSSIKKLENDDWVLTNNKGFFEAPIDDQTEIYISNKLSKSDLINDYYVDSEAYIAVAKEPGGINKAVLVVLRNEDDEEKVYEDTIKVIYKGSNQFRLNNNNEYLNYYEGSIIVKDGKLISGSNISINEDVYVIANRSYDDGEYYADIVKIEGTSVLDSVVICRGKIKNISEDSEFTLSSFSEFSGSKWEFNNTPKTFMLDRDTLFVNEAGIVNNRDFNEENYTGKIVNVVTRGSRAVLISEVPYGKYNFRGEVSLDYGKKLTSELSLKNVTYYNDSTGDWDTAANMKVIIREDTIILKDGNLIEKEDILRNDTVRIIKSSNQTGTQDEEAMIIIVE
jgi:hypothetical protein